MSNGREDDQNEATETPNVITESAEAAGSDDDRPGQADSTDAVHETKESLNDRPARSSLPVVLSVVALLATGGASYAGYTYLEKLRGELDTLTQLISDSRESQQRIRSRLDRVASDYEQQSRRFAANEQQMERQQTAMSQQASVMSQQATAMRQQTAEMKEALAAVYERVGREQSDWQVAEVEYLLEVANYQLTLDHNPVSATEALKAADSRLKNIGDPSWFDVRQKIAAEVMALDQVSMIDREGLAAKLDAAIVSVPELHMDLFEGGTATASSTPTVANVTGESVTSDPGVWDQLLEDSLRGLKSLVIVRRHDKPVSAMLSPDQQYFVKQNLQFQLETARFAMLRGDEVLYRESLDSAVSWLETYFDQRDSGVQQLQHRLRELAGIDIAPALPDISASLRLLRQKRESDQQTGQAS